MEAELRQDRVANPVYPPLIPALVLGSYSTTRCSWLLPPRYCNSSSRCEYSLEKGGYRSFPNFVSAAKIAHIEAGSEWTQLLDVTGHWVSRTVLRGIGLARHSCGFAFAKILKLEQSPEPLVNNGSQHPLRLALFAAIFLLR